jgi:hypothetical protein
VSTDLENDLRDALHARATRIAQTDLRYPHGRRPEAVRLRRRIHVSWVLAAALVVAAIVTVGLAVIPRSGDDRAAAQHLRKQLTGTSWTLTDVETGPASYGPGPCSFLLHLRADGTYVGTDTQQTITGRYEVSVGQIVFTPERWRYVNPPGHDIMGTRIIAGLDAALVGGGQGRPITTPAQILAEELVLQTDAGRLFFDSSASMHCDG